MQVTIYTQPPIDFTPRIIVSACYIRFEDRYLFLYRAPHTVQGKRWGVPAGKNEPGETPLEAAHRELFEETGIRVAELAPLPSRHIRSKVDFTYHSFHAEIDTCPDIVLSDEHTEFTWLKPKQAGEYPLIEGALELLDDLTPPQSRPAS